MRHPHRSGTDRPRDPAASMSLLTQILANPIDAGYHAYSRGGRRRGSHVGLLVIMVVAICLGFGSVVAVRNLRLPGHDGVKGELRAQIDERSAAVSALTDEVDALSARINTTAALVPRREGEEREPLALANSTSALRGPGLEVTLQDPLDSAIDSQTPAVSVRDQDLRMVVNALWSAGAEAISINDIRVGPATFVRTAGASILVNITPVQSPYVVRAIGDANALSVALVRGASGDYLTAVESLNGIRVQARASKSIDMPALELRTLHEARPAEGHTP